LTLLPQDAESEKHMSQGPNVFTYPRNEPGTQGHLDLVEPLRSFPRELEASLKDARNDELRFRADDEGWSIKEIVGHVSDSTRINHQRLYMMSTQTDPLLEAFDPEERRAEYVDGDLQSMLDAIRLWRSRTVDLLTSLVNWNWARSGQHEKFGRMSIRQLVDHMIADEGEHLAQLRLLRDAYAATPES
jgi:hypothetical protein